MLIDTYSCVCSNADRDALWTVVLAYTMVSMDRTYACHLMYVSDDVWRSSSTYVALADAKGSGRVQNDAHYRISPSSCIAHEVQFEHVSFNV